MLITACLRCPDRSDYRSKVADALCAVLDYLPFDYVVVSYNLSQAIISPKKLERGTKPLGY